MIFGFDFIDLMIDGTIMKFNSNKKLGGSYMQNSIFKTSNINPIPKMY